MKDLLRRRLTEIFKLLLYLIGGAICGAMMIRKRETSSCDLASDVFNPFRPEAEYVVAEYENYVMGGDHGHGHGHGHGHAPYKVPDWTIYKVEDIPALMKVKNKLAAKGLTDPWLRNEVWRYDPKHFPTMATRIRVGVSRGVITGLTLFGLTLIYEKLTASKDDHGHH